MHYSRDRMLETASLYSHTPISNQHVTAEMNQNIKWSWACRVLDGFSYHIDSTLHSPKAGDLALVKVDNIGYHKSITTVDNKKSRIYVGDVFVGVFGNRYAADAFEGEVEGLENMSILTAGGMIGTLKSKHAEISKPTKVSFVGFLVDENNKAINIKELKFHKSLPANKIKNLLIAVGTGMNAGKTTSSSKLIRGLSEKNLRVAACKLTGSVSNRDQDEMRSASAKSVLDFSDYGFPSTYMCTKEELLDLFNTMIVDSQRSNPDVIVMEIADGILQRETKMLLEATLIKGSVSGVILAANNAPSALYATKYLENLGYKIFGVTGAITSSPLSIKEFKSNSNIPVISSADSGAEFANTIHQMIEK